MPDPITSFERLYQRLERIPPLTLVVAAPEDETILAALDTAVQNQWIKPILVRQQDRLELLLSRLGLEPEPFAIEDIQPGLAAGRAVELLRSGEAQLLMKGKIPTAELLRAVLNRETGLLRPVNQRTEGEESAAAEPRLLSHVAVVESPHYPRLMLCTDGGVNIEQPLPVLRDILHNALELSRALDTPIPKVAAMALVENVTEKLPETRLAQTLAQEADQGRFGRCLVEGPLALDVALSAEAAECKGIPSKIAGKTDIFLGPNIIATNFMVKALMSVGGARGGGVVLGAITPIVLLSRSDAPDTRLNSIALALAAVLHQNQHPAFGNIRQTSLEFS
ncbi:MAG: phosphate acyltransferase [Candidatus Neomarinimicrobiota bacterium]